jgi:hypothetical protein
MNRLRQWKLVFFALLIAVIAACSEEQASPESILKSEKGGDFRGVNIGDERQVVLEKEGAHTVYSMPDELVYRIPSKSKDSTWYEISYNFNDDGLYNINLEIYSKESKQLELLKSDFEQYYLAKYGGSTQTGDHQKEWRTMTSEGRMISISMVDSLSNTRGSYIRVHFKEFR